MNDATPPLFATPAPEEPGTDVSPRRRWLLVFLLLASLTGIIAFVVMIQYRSGQMLSADRLQQAQQRWKTAGIKNYNLDITVTGRTRAQYQLQVRGSEIAAAWQNGQPFVDAQGKPDVRRAYYWTIPGLFEVLETEVANASKPDAPPCYTQIEFDPTLGYPRRFLRSSSGQNTLIEVDFRHVP